MPGLSRLFIGFDDLPGPAQAALIDIAWNTGIHGIAQFSHLRDAVSRRDWAGAAASCHRKTSREERNQWAADKFREAAAGGPAHR
jgi:GH24 family phage-related lysozyme (muramidase)